MTHDKRDMLRQIFDRMCFHTGIAPEHFPSRRQRFVASLLEYPDDLICAAYHHCQKYACYGQFPAEAEFIAFMTPEYEYRRRAQCMEA